MSASRDMPNIQPIVDKEIRRLSALLNAAKISHLVSERTLGLNQPNNDDSRENAVEPNLNDTENNENVINNKNTNNNNNNNISNSKRQTPPRFRSDVWRQVKLNNTDEDEYGDSFLHRTPVAPLQFADCKAISFRIARNNAEKQRRAQVQSNISRKVMDIDNELEARLHQIRIESAEEAQKRLHEKRQQREKALLDAIKQMDETARHDEEANRREMSAMIEHNRKIIDRANKMKREEEIRELYESMKASKQLFIGRYEGYVKGITMRQAELRAAGRWEAYAEQKDLFLQRYEGIIKAVNSREISITDVEALDRLCDDIRQESATVEADIAAHKAKTDEAATKAAHSQEQERKERAEAAAAAARAAEAVTATHPVTTVDAVDARQKPIKSVNVLSDFVNPQRYKTYRELMIFLDEYTASFKPLLEDQNWKPFRFNCQKAVNMPVNAISAVTGQHLRDKFDRIVNLLEGAHISDFKIAASEHPCGIQYCTWLLAQKFVNQAQDTFASDKNVQTIYAYAAIVVAIWQKFPQFGNLFLAMVYKCCPYIVPYFIVQVDGQNEEDYIKSLGYQYKNGRIESQQQYLARIIGLQRLYSAIMITPVRQSQNADAHPFGIQNGWIWIANFLNIEPLPDVCPTLLTEFLQVAGAEMWKTYKNQFQKLIVFIHQQYIPQLDMAGGSKARLENFINETLKNGRIAPPAGTLPKNFW